jgi:hypothetical protein
MRRGYSTSLGRWNSLFSKSRPLIVSWYRLPEIDIRIYQQLEDQCRTSSISRHLRNDRCEVATCAIAAQGDPGRITIEMSCVLGNPLNRGVVSFRCGWKFVFGVNLRRLLS